MKIETSQITSGTTSGANTTGIAFPGGLGGLKNIWGAMDPGIKNIVRSQMLDKDSYLVRWYMNGEYQQINCVSHEDALNIALGKQKNDSITQIVICQVIQRWERSWILAEMDGQEVGGVHHDPLARRAGEEEAPSAHPQQDSGSNLGSCQVGEVDK